MMTSTQVVKQTSVTTIDNSPSQDSSDPDDQTTQSNVTPGFKSIFVVEDFILRSFIVEAFFNKQSCISSLFNDTLLLLTCYR